MLKELMRKLLSYPEQVAEKKREEVYSGFVESFDKQSGLSELVDAKFARVDKGDIVPSEIARASVMAFLLTMNFSKSYFDDGSGDVTRRAALREKYLSKVKQAQRIVHDNPKLSGLVGFVNGVGQLPPRMRDMLIATAEHEHYGYNFPVTAYTSPEEIFAPMTRIFITPEKMRERVAELLQDY